MSLEANVVDITNDWEQPCVDIISGKIHSILPVMESLDSCTAAFTAMICEAKGLIENIFEGEKNSDDYSNEDNEMLEDLFSYRNGMASYMLNSFAFELCSLGDKGTMARCHWIDSLICNRDEKCKENGDCRITSTLPICYE